MKKSEMVRKMVEELIIIAGRLEHKYPNETLIKYMEGKAADILDMQVAEGMYPPDTLVEYGGEEEMGHFVTNAWDAENEEE